MLYREHTLRALISLFGIEGGFRSLGSRLAPDLWPAGGRLELFEQLWPLSLPREIDTPNDPEWIARAAFASLWQRAKRTGLALCGGSCARIGPRFLKGRDRPLL